MEILVRIVEICPLRERAYTDKTGAPQVFVSKGFKLAHGNSLIYAEAVQETARAFEANVPSKDFYYVADINFVTREFESNGEKRFALDARIFSLNVL